MSKSPARTIVDVWLYALLFLIFTAVYVPLVSVTVNCATITWGNTTANRVLLLCAGMYVVVPFRLLRRCRRLLKLEAWQCRECGYDLRGLGAGARCPECGAVGARGRSA